jgi:hypothetical protein
MNNNLALFLILILVLVIILVIVSNRKVSKPKSEPKIEAKAVPKVESVKPAVESFFYKNEYANNFKADWDMTEKERELQCKYTLGGLNQKYTVKVPINEQPIDFKKLFPLNYDGDSK